MTRSACVSDRRGHAPRTRLKGSAGETVGIVKQVRVGGYRPMERAEVNDAVGDIDDKRDCPSDTGADKHVASRLDACWVRGLVEECPWQTGVVHGVQVDDQVDLR